MKNDKKVIAAWAMYDWANSPFTTLVVTFVIHRPGLPPGPFQLNATCCPSGDGRGLYSQPSPALPERGCKESSTPVAGSRSRYAWSPGSWYVM